MIAPVPMNANYNHGATTSTAQVRQADSQANNTLQNQFPGWRMSDNQRSADGRLQKAHIKDDAGHEKTVWFDDHNCVSHAEDGDQ